MFQNSFQAGPYFEIFDPKDAINKSNKEKEKFYQMLYKVNTPQHFQKIFDKTLKCYIFEVEGHNTKIQLPKDGDLGLVQQYLVLQLNIGQSINWGLELILTDTSKTKRRIMLSSSIKTLEKKLFHLKTPIDIIKRGVWLNLCIDIWSFMEGFKSQTFRTLDMIILSSPCKLRKIYSSKNPIDENNQAPKTANFPNSISYQNQLINLRNLNQDLEFEESQASKKQIFATQFTVSQQKSTQQHQSQGSTPLKQKIFAQKRQQQQMEQQEVEEQIDEENFNDFGNEFEESQQRSDNFDIIGQKFSKPPQKIQSHQVNAKKPKLPYAKVQSRQNNNENSEITNDAKKDSLEQIQRSPLNNQNQEFQETKPQKSQNNPWNNRSSSKNKTAPQQQQQQQLQHQAQSPQSGQLNSKIQTRKKQMKEQQTKVNETKQQALIQKKNQLKKESVRQIVEEDKNNFDNNDDEDDYYQRTQKFSTINDQKVFQYARDEVQLSDSESNKQEEKLQEEEIEEYIEEDTLQSNGKEKQEKIEQSNQLMEDRKATDKNFNKRSISELKPKEQSDKKNANDQFEDSLEMPYGTSYGMNAQNTKSQQKWQKGEIKDEKEDSEATFAEGFYANQLKKYTEIQSRPFTPPYNSIVQLKNGVNKIEEEEVRGYEEEEVEDEGEQEQEQEQKQEDEINNSNENVIEVVYDPVMNCYYDPHTNQYYELKD